MCLCDSISMCECFPCEEDGACAIFLVNVLPRVGACVSIVGVSISVCLKEHNYLFVCMFSWVCVSFCEFFLGTPVNGNSAYDESNDISRAV